MRPALSRALASPFLRILIGSAFLLVPVIGLRSIIASWHIFNARAVDLAALDSSLLALLAYWFYVRRIERRAVDELAPAGALPELLAGMALGAALLTAVVGVLAAIGVFHYTGAAPASVLIQPLLASMASGIFEELWFRGVIFRLLESALGSWLALAISAALFGLIHLVNPHATLLGACSIILEAGVLLAAAYMVTRRLWLCIGVHMAWNFVEGGVFGLVVSGTNPTVGLFNGVLIGPEWLSGGIFGAEASVVAVAVAAIVAIVLLVIAARRGNILPPPWRRKTG